MTQDATLGDAYACLVDVEEARDAVLLAASRKMSDGAANEGQV